MAVERSEWPLPSQSRRVRGLFYLADGLLIGGTVAVLFLYGMFFLELESGGVHLRRPAVSGILIILVLWFVLRRLGVLSRIHGSSREQPRERRDWAQTRQWHWTIAISLCLAALLIGGLWTLPSGSQSLTPLLILLLTFGPIISGLLLRLYLFHRMGLQLI